MAVGPSYASCLFFFFAAPLSQSRANKRAVMSKCDPNHAVSPGYCSVEKTERIVPSRARRGTCNRERLSSKGLMYAPTNHKTSETSLD